MVSSLLFIGILLIYVAYIIACIKISNRKVLFFFALIATIILALISNTLLPLWTTFLNSNSLAQSIYVSSCYVSLCDSPYFNIFLLIEIVVFLLLFEKERLFKSTVIYIYIKNIILFVLASLFSYFFESNFGDTYLSILYPLFYIPGALLSPLMIIHFFKPSTFSEFWIKAKSVFTYEILLLSFVIIVNLFTSFYYSASTGAFSSTGFTGIEIFFWTAPIAAFAIIYYFIFFIISHILFKLKNKLITKLLVFSIKTALDSSKIVSLKIFLNFSYCMRLC